MAQASDKAARGKKLDRALFKPFLRACTDIILTVLEDVPEADGEPTEMEEIPPENDVVVMIGITGMVVGRMILAMKQTDALPAASVMVGKPLKGFNELARSALGEMANMIAGRATTELSQGGLKCDITPPSILIGKNISMGLTKGVDLLSISFKTSTGKIDLILGLKEAGKFEKILKLRKDGGGANVPG